MARKSVLAIAFLLVACAHVAPIEQGVIADRLFCGQSIPGGGSVSEDEWNAFIREVVTPRFPDGLTIWSAEGQWRGADGTIVREPVRIIEILHPFSSQFDTLIDEIAEEYKRRFRQEAVLRVTMPARMEFVE